jgi:hypothetical protein
MQKLGLEVPAEIVTERKRSTQFKRGSIPHSKGKKQAEYMSPEAIERAKAARFKVGHLPHNSVGVTDGTIRTRKNHRGEKQNFIRLSLSKWQELQRYNWEQVYGPIEKGMVLRSRDGNILNCDVSNWELITKGENASRNIAAYHARKRKDWKRSLDDRIARLKEKRESKIARNEKKIQGREQAKIERATKKVAAKFSVVVGKVAKIPKVVVAKPAKVRIPHEQKVKKCPIPQKFPAAVKPVKVKKPREKKIKVRPVTSAIVTRSGLLKRPVKKVFAIKQVDLSKMVRVVINKSTSIYIRRDQDPETERMLYLARHAKKPFTDKIGSL